MSRIGKKTIVVPEGVTVTVADYSVTVKGPKGSMTQGVHPDIAVQVEEGLIRISPKKNTKRTPALWGLTRTLVANMVEGVTRGFRRDLEFEGIGFRVNSEGGNLHLQLGFSHPVKFPAPQGIIFSVEKNVIGVSGIDKHLVGETAARVRSLKPPEPYKGKGIRYRGEVIRRKAGKKAVASA